ncbi:MULTISPECIES: hypothetical protein [unclassified Nostoc]|uniref:hypothetical protein n=1 Tax=unclassified Nostoc TaxID=2593658 RepID=UPI0026147A31|nr:hypothetical protein [Nostoc sp. S13]MDF5736742.1 hypothetical protein [Nostoc sp. S13]
MKKNSEVRIQESESRRSRTRESVTLSVGDSDPRLIEDHKTRKFGEGAKTPIIHPPVVQNTQLNSDS